MELDQILKQRKSCRNYLPELVSQDKINLLIDAAQLAPSSCNLQTVSLIVIQDRQLLKKLASEVSHKFRYAPLYFVVLVDKRFSRKRYSRIMSAGMFCENLILKAVDMGLATCPFSEFGSDRKVRRFLSIPYHQDLVLLIAVGYPAWPELSHPRYIVPGDKIVSYNRYDLPKMNDSVCLNDHTIESVRDYRQRIATVYLDRLRLHGYKDILYHKAAETMTRLLGKRTEKIVSVINITEDDGFALEVFRSQNFFRQCNLFIASPLEGAGNFFEKKFGCRFIRIDFDNNIVNLKEAITGKTLALLIFQLKFWPQADKLVASLQQQLNPGDLVFVSETHDRLYRQWVKLLLSLSQNFLGRRNIYEANTFFRQGPWTILRRKGLVGLFESLGFKLLSEEKSSDNKSVVSGFLFERV